MLNENLEGKWIDCFEKSFLMSGKKNNIVAIISESQSRKSIN